MLVAFLLSACAPPADGCVTERPSAPVFDEGPGLPAVCDALARGLCTQWARCGCASGAESVDACTARIEDACTSWTQTDDVRAALASGVLAESGREERALVDAITSGTSGCDPLDVDLSGIVFGRIPMLAPCTEIRGAFEPCEPRARCVLYPFGGPNGEAPGTFCEPGGVVPLVSRGMPCIPHAACSPTLRCARVCGGGYYDGVCVERVGLGERCETTDDCSAGLCAPDPHTYDFEWRGRCVAAGAGLVGDPCTLDAQCASGRCRLEAPRSNWFRAGTCQPLLGDGAPCFTAAECSSGACLRRVEGPRAAPCPAGEVCDAADCTCSELGLVGRCGSPLPLGALCGPELGPCATGGFCPPMGIDEICQPAPPPSRHVGEACDDVDRCVEGTCSGGVCRAPLRSLGESCAQPSECASAACLAGACAPAVCVPTIGRGRFRNPAPVLTPR